MSSIPRTISVLYRYISACWIKSFFFLDFFQDPNSVISSFEPFHFSLGSVPLFHLGICRVMRAGEAVPGCPSKTIVIRQAEVSTQKCLCIHPDFQWTGPWHLHRLLPHCDVLLDTPTLLHQLRATPKIRMPCCRRQAQWSASPAYCWSTTAAPTKPGDSWRSW